MPSSRIPSPARSQGQKSTPRRYRPRCSRSVGSPARSNTSVKLSTMIQIETFAVSPMPSRRSVLTDTTDVDIPTRRSWWKKLDENSREIMEVFNTEGPVKTNMALEEYIDVDILSQEKDKKNYTLELPESSDGESINSIVIPQKKLFTQKYVGPQKNFIPLIDNRDLLTKPNKTLQDHEKTLNVGRKNLLNQGAKHRTKPLFPSALLNISPNKTVANKTNDFAMINTKGQAKNLFGNRGGTKRKNMFTDFIVSESEDEIPEIQPKVFGFQKTAEQKRRPSLKSQDGHDCHPTSPTSSITETEMEDWRFLPCSTMVDHQLEDGLRTTPSKRARLSKLSEPIETSNRETNLEANKSKSLPTKPNLSKSKNMSINKDLITTDNIERKSVTAGRNEKTKASIHEVDAPSNNTMHDSLRKNKSKSSRHDKSNSISLPKTVNENFCKIVADKNTSSTTNKLNGNKSIKTISRIDQVLQSDDDEDISLVYENDDEHEAMKVIEDGEDKNRKVTSPKLARNQSKQFQNVSQSEFIQIQNKSNNENNITKNKTNNKINTTDIKHLSEIVDTEEVVVNNALGSLGEKSVNEQNGMEKDIQEDQCFNGAKKATQQNTHNGNRSNEEIETCFEKQRGKSSKSNIHNQELEIHIQAENKIGKLDDAQAEVREQCTNIDTNEVNVEEHDNREGQIEINNLRENVSQDVVDNININYKSKGNNDSQNKIHSVHQIKEKENKNVSISKLDSTKKRKQKHDAIIPSPEICRQPNKTSDAQSFTVDGRSTSIRKTKSNIKNLTLRPSLASLRESTGLSDSRNSSAEGSGWDSHRTTRATLRQTFGKDFTPRKSLRALVMEKSAKRRTNFTEMNAEFSRIPQANSTELPVTEPLDLDASPNKDISDEEPRLENQDREFGSQKAISTSRRNKANDSKLSNDIELNQTNQSNRILSLDLQDGGVQENNESDKEISESGNVDNTKDVEDNNMSRNTDACDENQDINESADEHDTNESNQEASHDDSVDVQDMNESIHDEYNEYPDPDQEIDQKESDVENTSDTNKMHDSNQEASDVENAGDTQVINESTDVQEKDDSNHEEVSYDEGVAEDQEMSVSDHVISSHVDDDEDGLEIEELEDAADEDEDDHEIQESDVAEEESDDEASLNADNADDAQKINESDDAQIESDDEVSHDDNEPEIQDMNDSDQEVSQNVSQENLESELNAIGDNENEENEILNENSQELEEVDFNEYEDGNNELDYEISKDSGDDESNLHRVSSEREESRKTRQTTLKMYLQKVMNRKLERKKILIDEVMNTLKAPTRDILNPFKVPAIPKLRRMKTQQSKVKPMKSTVVNMEMLPAEVLEDMKYKPPKRYRPTNASWITKRLYKFLETKLEPKYDYKARVRSEKLVETIYSFVKDIRRHDVAPSDAVDALKREMARLDIVKTHVEFYEFFHEYMPREVRVKVVPDLFNKISLPRRGVFSEILR